MTETSSGRSSLRASPPQIEVPESPSRADSSVTDLESSLGNPLHESSLGNTGGLNESATNDNTLTSHSQSVNDEVKVKKKDKKKRGSGGINDYQIYREFRLQMVESFGSLGAAFYEVEREARSKLSDSTPRGEIPRTDFFRVVHEKMQLFGEHETAALFAFLTNADLGGENVSVATYRHFGVSEKQWKSVMREKAREEEGCQTGMFASTPQGTSTGVYLRPMHVSDAASMQRAKKTYKGTPWRTPQKAWEPRALSGDGPGLKAEDICSETRGRWAQMSFSVAPCKKLKAKLEYPIQSLLKKPDRKKDCIDENTHVISSCPTRRAEMSDMATTLPVGWWPYKSKPRTYANLSRRAVTPR